MTLNENFDQLKQEFAALGYNSPHIDNDLRQNLVSGKDDFVIYHHEDFERLTLNCRFNMLREQPGEPLKLDYYESLMMDQQSGIMSSRSFGPEVRKDEACQALAKGIQYPSAQDNASPWILRSETVQQYLAEDNPGQVNYFNYLNGHTMNEDNLAFNQKSIQYLGFDQNTADQVTDRIKQQLPEFQVNTSHEHYNNSADYTLYFKKSSDTDMYFFNKYNAT